MHVLTAEEIAMSANSEVLKHDLRKSVDDLKKLGNEIRGDLRAAGVDARKQWKHFLEPQLVNVEKLAKDIGAASRDVVARTAAAFSAFQTSIKTTKKTAPRRHRRSVPAKRTH
jgi:hypothetical protein